MNESVIFIQFLDYVESIYIHLPLLRKTYTLLNDFKSIE